MNKCPYCGDNCGYFTKSYVVQELFFTFDGECDGSNAGEEWERNTPKNKKCFCRTCNKYIGMLTNMKEGDTE